jgi:CheY-like chemotaxis protein
VSGFVRQHGGTVSVHSPPEGGTRFVVELPAAGELQEVVTRGKRAPARQTTLSPAGALSAEKIVRAATEKTPHVLVVEDEATVANLIADVLREEGMQVKVLPDGRRALEAVRLESYDLAICDLKMPGMDGQIFYRELVESRNPLYEHILFVTGDVVAQRTQEFLERHHLPHVAKPFRVEELSLAVRRMLSGNLQAATP